MVADVLANLVLSLELHIDRKQAGFVVLQLDLHLLLTLLIALFTNFIANLSVESFLEVIRELVG